MKTYTVKQDQSIYDIAIQLYGDAGQIFKIIEDNPSIETIDSPLVRMDIVYDETLFTDLTVYLQTNGINLTTGMGLQDEVNGDGQFDDSFDDSFA